MRNYLLFFLAVIVLTSCGRVLGKRIKGSGTITSSLRQGSGFTEIEVSSNINVYVRQDSLNSIRVETDDNIQEHILTNVNGSTLKISLKRGYNPKPTKGMKVYVAGPSFSRFAASGACNFFSENQLHNAESVEIRLSGASHATMDINSPLVSADLSGAGKLNLKGQSRTLDLKGTGSSDLHCADMMAENVKVSITGAGDAEVFASANLDIRVTGAGTVKYKGNPSVTQKVSGAGTVKKLN